MNQQEMENLRGRTDSKLRYARLTLGELEEHRRSVPGRGDEFERAHVESFLFHLFGAKDAFIEELNVYYNCGLRKTPESHISPGEIRKVLELQGRKSPELAEIFILENEEDNWLFHAGKMRHHVTHVAALARVFLWGGTRDGEVWLKNPEKPEASDLEKDVLILFAEWAQQMESLLDRLRQSAIEVNRESLGTAENGSAAD